MQNGRPRYITALLGIVLCLAAAETAPCDSGSSPAPAPPGEIAGVSKAMQECVAKHEIAGAVTLVATGDKVIHLGVVGQADIAADKPMRPDTIFWIASMTSIQTSDLKTGFTDGNGWGLGWCVVRKPQGVTGMLSPGTFGHGGAYGTQAWIDPVKQTIYVLMVQRANFPNADASDVRRAFQAAATAP